MQSNWNDCDKIVVVCISSSSVAAVDLFRTKLICHSWTQQVDNLILSGPYYGRQNLWSLHAGDHQCSLKLTAQYGHLVIWINIKTDEGHAIFLTWSTAMQFNSHGDMSIPSTWVNTDTACYHWWIQSARDDWSSIIVSNKVLQEKKEKKKYYIQMQHPTKLALHEISAR